MRRTPLKRGTKELKRTAMPRATKPVKYKRSKPRRVSVMRDKGYLKWLKTRRCVACDFAPNLRRYSDMPEMDIIDPAHGPVNGMGSKGPDNSAISLCRYHHTQQHSLGWPEFELKYGFSREEQAKLAYAAYLKEHGNES